MPVFPNICNNLALRKAGRNLGVLYDDVIGPSGLRGGQFTILAHVHTLDRPTMKELASELVMDLSALGHTLKPLERDGYVALVRNELDGRSRRVVLTDAGAAKLAEAGTLWRVAQDRFEHVLGPAEAAYLRKMLAVLASDAFTTKFRGSAASQRRESATDVAAEGAPKKRISSRSAPAPAIEKRIIPARKSR